MIEYAHGLTFCDWLRFMVRYEPTIPSNEVVPAWHVFVNTGAATRVK